MTIGEELKKIGLRVAYKYLEKDPEPNMPKLMDWVDKFVNDDVLVPQRAAFRKVLDEKDSNWYQLLSSLWVDVDENVRKAMFENLVVNANALATLRARESKKNYKCNIPWALVMDITNNEDGEGLSFDKIDEIIDEAKDLGTFMFIFVGDNDLQRREEIIAICNKNEDCQFMYFTSGLQIDEDFANHILRVRNLIPAISLSGTDKDKDICPIMDMLHEKKLPYGTYCVYDKENMDNFANEEFYDNVIKMGGKFCFFFSLLSEKKDKVYPLTKELRNIKPLLTINFCKDKAITGGCLAGGKYYCFVNAKGEVEPCVFLHESDSNVYEGTLLEAYKAPLFMEYMDNLPKCNVYNVE